MANHLAGENSPYLLQHADNPVDWFPWEDTALEKARLEDKPIFLSIGYAACHWCHVMAHESFEDPETAAVLNQHFISIKVDREERPDLDTIYMQAVAAMTGHGGWPMSVFLTPDGRPFYGGTYFPPEPRHNMPAFREVLHTIASLWSDDREQLLHNAGVLTDHIRETLQQQARQSDTDFDPGFLEEAAEHLAQSYNWKTGGWGRAPKFPHPMTVEFALRRAARGDDKARQMAVHALDAMARGGMYDVLGGGFARYSVDDHWHVPHFEKMLYDNALLARSYLHGFLLTGKQRFRSTCEETLDFVLREMTDPGGGFYSSLDADSEGIEGKFYTWTDAELHEALGNDHDYELFSRAYGIKKQGDLEGRNVLHRVEADAELAEQFDLPESEVNRQLAAAQSALFEIRKKRVRPALDDKILTSWNALMLITFAEAGRYLDRKEYTLAAERNASFLLDALLKDRRLLRSWRNGTARHNGYLEDYASLVQALLALYQTAPDPRWYGEALNLAEDMIAQFRSPEGGFHDTPIDHEPLLVRPGDTQDNATPSGSALAAGALLQLAALEGRQEWRTVAETLLASGKADMLRYPTAFSQWLCAADFAAGPIFEVAVIGEPDHPGTKSLMDTLWNEWRPNIVAAASSWPPSAGHPKLLEGRPLQKELPTAYVCSGFSCQQPVNTAGELENQLRDSTAL